MRFKIEIKKKSKLKNKKNKRFKTINNISREITLSNFLIKK